MHLETAPDPVHDAWFEIVGVVADAKNRGLQDRLLTPKYGYQYTVTGSFEARHPGAHGRQSRSLC